MSNHYAISKRSDGWAIVVDGSMLMICERKKAAIRAVMEATARHAVPVGAPDPMGSAAPRPECHSEAGRIVAAAN